MTKRIEITECPRPPRVIDLTGQRFGNLTVLRFVGLSSTNAKYWECKCDCGETKTIAAKHFTTGATISCRCFQKAQASKATKTHGESKWSGATPEYSAYSRAKCRCQNPQDKSYPYYGGRGIEFRFNSYEEFLEEVGRRPSAEYTLDRIDVNGHYEKGNLRWATYTEQARNTRSNRLITINNVTKCLAEWSELMEVDYNMVHHRLARGWCNECAIFIRHKQGTCIHNQPPQ